MPEPEPLKSTTIQKPEADQDTQMPKPSVDKIYEQLCTDIRKTDEISFKLLGLVPLISGVGITAIALMSDKKF